MSNVVSAACLPGRSLWLAEPVSVGDLLRIGSLTVHVVYVGPESGMGYDVAFADPYPYAGMGWINKPVAAGTPVTVVGHLRREEQR